MRVALGVVFVTLTTGCDPCAGDPTFADPDGRLGEEEMTELEDAYAEFVAAVGPERVCVDRVEVASTHGAGEAAADGRAWPVAIDPQAADLTRELWLQLCEGLDGAEGLTDQAPHLFEAREFASVCADGPRNVDWLAEVEAACEVSPLTELQQFMAHEVYPLAPQGRNDGALSAVVGAPLRFPDVYAVTRGGPLGAGVLLVTYRDDTYAEQRAVFLDPETGVATEVMSGLTSEVFWEGYGGADGTVVLDRTSDTSRTGTVHVIDPATLAVTSVVIEGDYGDPSVGTVSEGWLYVAPPVSREGALHRIDLASGAVEPIALPAADAGDAEVLLDNVVAAPGGVVVFYVEGVVTVHGDYSTTEVKDHVLARWSAAAGTWTELLRGMELSPAGTTTDRRIVGTLTGVDDVLAAYSYEDDALTISDDVCLSTSGRPDFVAADRAWHIDNTKKGAVLTPYSLD